MEFNWAPITSYKYYILTLLICHTLVLDLSIDAWILNSASYTGIVQLCRLLPPPTRTSQMFNHYCGAQMEAWVRSGLPKINVVSRYNSGWIEPALSVWKRPFEKHPLSLGALITSKTREEGSKSLVGEEKVGVLLLNLGGPETLDDVQPFLFNLFADPVNKHWHIVFVLANINKPLQLPYVIWFLNLSTGASCF